MSNGGYRSRSFTNAEVFKNMPFLKRDKLPNLFTLKNTKKHFELGEYSEEDFNSCLLKDIEDNIEVLKSLSSLIFELNIKSDSIEADNRKGTIKLQFESGEQIINNNEIDVFYNIFYAELVNVVGDKVKKFARDGEQFKKRFYLSKSEINAKNDLNRFLKESNQNIVKNELEDIFADYFNNPVSLTLDNKEKAIRTIIPKTIATIYEDKQNSTKFPLSEEELVKANKNSSDEDLNEFNKSLLELNDLVNSDSNKYFEKIEVDLSDTKKYIDKNTTLRKVIDTFHTVNDQNLTLNDKVVFRIRKFGKHESKYRIVNGVYMPAQPGIENPTISVKLENGGAEAVMHEFGHLIDLTQFGEESELRNSMVNYFVQKLNLEGLRGMDIDYYTKPTEVVARLIEIGHDLKYPRDNSKSVRLVKDRIWYEDNKNIYFDLPNLSNDEKNMIVEFYDIFCENSLDLELKESKTKELVGQLKTRRQLLMEDNKKNRRKLTIDELADTELRKTLREFDTKTIESILKTNLEKENKGKFTQFSTSEIISHFLNFLAADILQPFNTKTEMNRKSIDWPKFRISHEMRIKTLDLLFDYFNKLSPEEQLNILQNNETSINFKKTMRLAKVDFSWSRLSSGGRRIVEELQGNANELLGEILDYDYYNDLGFMNYLDEEQIIKLSKLDNEIITDSLNKAGINNLGVQKFENIMELFSYLTDKEIYFSFDISKEEFRELILEARDLARRHGSNGLLNSTGKNNEMSFIIGSIVELKSYTTRNYEEIIENLWNTIGHKFNKKGTVIDKNIVLDNFDFHIPEKFLSKNVIKNLSNDTGKNSQEFRKNILFGTNPDIGLEALNDSITEEEKKVFALRKQITIQKVIPEVKRKISNFNKDEILNKISSLTNVDKIELGNVFRSKVILRVVERLSELIYSQNLEDLKQLKEEFNSDTTLMIDNENSDFLIKANESEEDLYKIIKEYDLLGLDNILEDIENDLDDNLTIEEKEELEEIKSDILSRKEELTFINHKMIKFIKEGDLDKLKKLYESQISIVLDNFADSYREIKSGNSIEELSKPTKQTQLSFDF